MNTAQSFYDFSEERDEVASSSAFKHNNGEITYSGDQQMFQETMPTQPSTWRYNEQEVLDDLLADFSRAKEEMISDFDLLGEIRAQDNGLLSLKDYQHIVMLMRRYKHPVVVPTLQNLIDRRREIYYENQQHRGEEFSLEYEELAIAFIEFENEYTEMVSNFILEHFSIDPLIFQETYFHFEHIEKEQQQTNEKIYSWVRDKRKAKAKRQNKPLPRLMTKSETKQSIFFELEYSKENYDMLAQAPQEER